MIDWSSMGGRDKYHTYLASREWGKLREQVKARSGGRCEHCRSYPATAVHHLTYARIYQERVEDLMHICGACHDFVHGKTDIDPRNQILASSGVDVDDDTLKCPLCGDIYLHHTYVRVYSRAEDDDTLVTCVTDPSGVTWQSSHQDEARRNPSSRRHGLAIGFYCENCGEDHKFELTIQQHKGNTYLHWRPTKRI